MENAKFEAYKKKLEGICDENNLNYRFRDDTYPITLTITPLQGVEEQLMMLEMAEDKPFNSPDAKLVLSMVDGDLSYKFDDRLSISDALFGKIKNLFKNMHYTYLQYFHREVIEKGLLSGKIPEAFSEEPEDLEEDIDAEDLEDPIPDDDEDTDGEDEDLCDMEG